MACNDIDQRGVPIVSSVGIAGNGSALGRKGVPPASPDRHFVQWLFAWSVLTSNQSDNGGETCEEGG